MPLQPKENWLFWVNIFWVDPVLKLAFHKLKCLFLNYFLVESSFVFACQYYLLEKDFCLLYFGFVDMGICFNFFLIIYCIYIIYIYILTFVLTNNTHCQCHHLSLFVRLSQENCIYTVFTFISLIKVFWIKVILIFLRLGGPISY